MSSNNTLRLASYGALALAAGVFTLMPMAMQSAVATPGTDTIDITGIARDFRSTDANFVPPVGTPWQHVAGNVDFELDADYRPVFGGGGSSVATQWRNAAAEPIPPHLYFASRTIRVTNAPSVAPGTTLDTWDSSLGPYGGANVGGPPHFHVGAEMPEVTEPVMGPSVGNVLYSNSGTTTLATDLHCDTLSIRDLHTLNIMGNVTILCEGNLVMRDGGTIALANGSSSLTLYVKGAITIVDSTVGSSAWRYWQVKLVQLTGQPVRLGDGATMNAELIAPASLTSIENTSEFFGQITSAGLAVLDTAEVHIDGYATDACGAVIHDVEGAKGGSSAGAIASAADFSEWFADVLPRNLYTSSTITLVKNASGVYEYINDEFFPIDGLLFGNEGDNHNYYFTFTFTVEFVHRACEGRFFEFEGADDAWMFVDSALAMDLGGIRAGTSQYVEFDRLDLVDGQTYRLHFFYAQRNPSQASFGVRTNLDLIRPNDPFAIGSGAD